MLMAGVHFEDKENCISERPRGKGTQGHPFAVWPIFRISRPHKAWLLCIFFILFHTSGMNGPLAV
jgi:hypothetical protein